ncbi:MAG TPA: phosphoenolpyruvate carboxykinase [Anaerolineaceae bacterium]|nr:phosphoenolpyruvate carboxykinase [Anaerolineaceae bacterium]
MQNGSFHFYKDKIIMRVRNRVCNNSEELIRSELFEKVLWRFLKNLEESQSPLLAVFPQGKVDRESLEALIDTLFYLTRLPSDKVVKIVEGSSSFLKDPFLLNELVEQLYNYWRHLHRLIICDSVFDRFDQKPYRTFNDLVESLMHIVRSTYRTIQENITGNHPKIYRQVSAGAEIGAIALPYHINYAGGLYDSLQDIFVIRQALIYPPMIFKTPMNKRTGQFVQVQQNPLESLNLPANEWLCYPAKVGELLIMVYFCLDYFELGFSLCNLFELADEEDLKRKPDAIFIYGAPPESALHVNGNETVFYEDEQNNCLIGSIPYKDEFGYFGYLKKMILTLHNIKRMRDGFLPFHGAMVRITLHGCKPFSLVVMGDSGAGKSETIEALRRIRSSEIQEILIVADDMGSFSLSSDEQVLGFGTEMGAFVRLDDLQAGYAFGQIDRTIIMNPDQVNARVVLPVTRYEYLVKGIPVDAVLYANNYEEVDGSHKAIEQFQTPQDALQVFRRGAVMSKGTTTTTGIVENYFANIFGPPQYHDLHEHIAQSYFTAFFEQGLFVGQLRTMLGIPGHEHSGPEQAALELIELIRSRS